MKYLIVEDVKETREEIIGEFERPPATIALGTDSGEEALKILEKNPDIDGVILDLKLNGKMHGIEVLKEIRSMKSKVRDATIGILTSDTSPHRQMEAVENLADGYMNKDYFSSAIEIRKFMHLLENRKRKVGAATIYIYEFRGWILDPLYRRLLNPDKAEIELPNSEFDLLVAFVTNSTFFSTSETSNPVMTYEKLIHQVYISATTEGGRRATFSKLLSRLRKKIDIDKTKPLIENIYGKGFRFLPKVRLVTRE